MILFRKPDKTYGNPNANVENTRKPQRAGPQLFETFTIIEIGQKFIENGSLYYTDGIRKPDKKPGKPEC